MRRIFQWGVSLPKTGRWAIAEDQESDEPVAQSSPQYFFSKFGFFLCILGHLLQEFASMRAKISYIVEKLGTSVPVCKGIGLCVHAHHGPGYGPVLHCTFNSNFDVHHKDCICVRPVSEVLPSYTVEARQTLQVMSI